MELFYDFLKENNIYYSIVYNTKGESLVELDYGIQVFYDSLTGEYCVANGDSLNVMYLSFDEVKEFILEWKKK